MKRNWESIAEKIRCKYKQLDTKEQKKLRYEIYEIYAIAENTLWQKFEGKLTFKPAEVEVIDRYMEKY